MPTRLLLVGPPRSGAGLLQVLWLTDAAWSRSGLSGNDPLEELLDSVADSARGSGDWSHRITDGSGGVSEALRTSADSGGDLTIDWAPRNSLRLAALASTVDDVRVIHVVRDPRIAVPSLVQAWRSGRFVSEPGLPGWWGEPWSFPLIPGWRDLAGKPLHEIAAAQWFGIDTAVREDLDVMTGVPVAQVTYEALIADPGAEIVRVAGELGVEWAGEVPSPAPMSPFTVSAPDPRKWQRDISETLAAFSARSTEHKAFIDWADSAGLASYRQAVSIEQPSPLAGQVSRPSAGTPFMSQHSSSLVELLDKAASSLIITTYKSGHVILARTRGDKIDTNVIGFDRPMGVAVAGSRLAIGTGQTIDTYTNQPNVAARLEGEERRHDAVFLPRSVVYTGDIAIHEMGYDADGVLWFVNTKFSCLCTQDLDHSFAVRWTPGWITSLAGEDRCHLNGMAMIDGRPKYATALAQTDTPGGWREHKGTSGVIIDIDTHDIVVDGLAMPHSPRWHDGRMWVLQSGLGTLSTVDLAAGTVTEVAKVPGFTRGLAFIGRYALIGLSQVRESVFTGLPITESAAERNCGVWVVDTQTGNIVGMLRFEGAVQEIFDVSVLPGIRWPTLLHRGEATANAFVLTQEDLRRVAPRG